MSNATETHNSETIVRVQHLEGLTLVQTLANGTSPDGEGSLNTYVLEAERAEPRHTGWQGYAVCADCNLAAAGYTSHELGYDNSAALSLLEGARDVVPEGQVSTYGTARCEGCGSGLAGERYALSVRFPALSR